MWETTQAGRGWSLCAGQRGCRRRVSCAGAGRGHGLPAEPEGPRAQVPEAPPGRVLLRVASSGVAQLEFSRGPASERQGPSRWELCALHGVRWELGPEEGRGPAPGGRCLRVGSGCTRGEWEESRGRTGMADLPVAGGPAPDRRPCPWPAACLPAGGVQLPRGGLPFGSLCPLPPSGPLQRQPEVRVGRRQPGQLRTGNARRRDPPPRPLSACPPSRPVLPGTSPSSCGPVSRRSRCPWQMLAERRPWAGCGGPVGGWDHQAARPGGAPTRPPPTRGRHALAR